MVATRNFAFLPHIFAPRFLASRPSQEELKSCAQGNDISTKRALSDQEWELYGGVL